MLDSDGYPGQHIPPKLTLHKLVRLHKSLLPLSHLLEVPLEAKNVRAFIVGCVLWAEVVESYQFVVNLKSNG